MVLELAEPREQLLARSPLKLVVSQIRYTKTPAASKLPAGQAVQRALGDPTNWRLNQVENRTIAITASATELVPAPALETQTGWRLTSEPSGWIATVMPD